MFKLTDDYIKELVVQSAFIEFFVVPLGLAITFPIAFLIFALSEFSLKVNCILVAFTFGVASLFIAVLRKRKLSSIRKEVNKNTYINAKLYYADYFGTTKKFGRTSIKYYLVYRDCFGVNRTSQISLEEYERLQSKINRENGVIVLQYLTYNKKKYLYQAFNADTFINESSLPIENQEGV